MQIQIDSREKPKAIAKILSEFDRKGVKYHVSKLIVGDYMNMDNPRLIIDRKQNLSEIYSNICHERSRFKKELHTAAEIGIKMIILCEHGGKIKGLEDVKVWLNPRLKETPYAWNGLKLHREISNLSKEFGADFVFCSKADTGKKIIEILGGGSVGEFCNG